MTYQVVLLKFVITALHDVNVRIEKVRIVDQIPLPVLAPQITSSGIRRKQISNTTWKRVVL